MIKILNLPPDCRVVPLAGFLAQTKAAQLRASNSTGAATDKIATETWAAEPTLRCIRDYVAQTLKKA